MANSNVKLEINVELMIDKLYKQVHCMISNNLLMAYYVKVTNIELNPFLFFKFYKCEKFLNFII